MIMSRGGKGGGHRGGTPKQVNDNKSNQGNPTSPVHHTGIGQPVPPSLPSGPKPHGK